MSVINNCLKDTETIWLCYLLTCLISGIHVFPTFRGIYRTATHLFVLKSTLRYLKCILTLYFQKYSVIAIIIYIRRDYRFAINAWYLVQHATSKYVPPYRISCLSFTVAGLSTTVVQLK